MKSPDDWKAHYIVEAGPEEVQQDLEVLVFTSGGRNQELLSFTSPGLKRNILISQGTAGHAYVFAELAHFMHSSGFNAFVMPKRGGATVNELLTRPIWTRSAPSPAGSDRTSALMGKVWADTSSSTSHSLRLYR